MPTVSQAIVFTPHRYIYLAENGTRRPISTVKQIPPKELYNRETDASHVNVENLKSVPNKPAGLSLLAKCLIAGAAVAVAAAIAIGVSLGIVLSRGATTSDATTTATTTAAGYVSRDIFWSFDNNVLDLYNNYPANTSGNPTYTTSYLGIGAALSLTRSSSQYAAVTTHQLLFNSNSFTIEAWIYPISLSSVDYGIFGQCHANTTNLCMFFIIRTLKLYCGLSNNGILGSTSITMNVWSHVACVYDLATQTQQVWLNGVLDGSSSSPPYQGSIGHTTIGVTYLTPPGSNFFNGYLDQMQFSFRAKNSTEILNDATLMVYYSFDSSSVYDDGPNGINSTSSGSPTNVTGRVNQALQFSSGDAITQSYTPFYMLGISGQPFTMSLWVKPTGALGQSTIVFVNAAASGWCVGFITTQSNGQLMLNLWIGSTRSLPGPILLLNMWTHVGFTYSVNNGIRLYIDGTQYATSGGFTTSAASVPVIVTVGSNLGRSSCSPFHGGSFDGAVDEFYAFCRELTAAQIFALANP